MSYSVQNIRNVCLVGHSGNGKTALAESLLFMTGAINRMGNSADGNTVCDYDPEEIRRQISISTAVAPLEYKGCKINLLDTPGAFDFSGEVMEALRAADAAIIDSLMAGAMVGDGTSYADLTYTITLNPNEGEQYGVGFRKGSDLVEKLNQFFVDSYADGTMMELAETYGVQAAIIPQE